MRLSLILILAVAFFAFAPQGALAGDGDILKLRSDIVVGEDQTVRDVVAIGGDVTIFGKVDGEVFVLGGDLTLKPGSYVRDDITVIGGRVSWEPGAAIGKNLSHIKIPRLIPAMRTLFGRGLLVVWATLSVLALLGFLCLAIVITALLPKHLGAVVGALEASFWKALLWGVLCALAIVPIAILLAVSIVGILLIPLEVLLVAVAIIVGYIAAAMFVGKGVLKALGRGRAAHPIVEIIAGVFILFFIGFVPVIGAAIKAILVTAGFGAVAVTRFGTGR